MKKFGGKGRKSRSVWNVSVYFSIKQYEVYLSLYIIPYSYDIIDKCTNFEDLENLLKAAERKLWPISGDGKCMFRALAMVMYGSESFHDTVRSLLVDYIEKNTKDFKKYLLDETMEMHLKRLKQPGQWGTHVELKATANILKLPIYIYTPTLKADG